MSRFADLTADDLSQENRRLRALLRRVQEILVPGCGEFGLTDEQQAVINEIAAELAKE